MKHFLLIMIFALCGFTYSLPAQNIKTERTEKVQALKIAFITQKLELTSDEAQKFWPVYNRYETEIKQVMKNNRMGGDAIDNEEKILVVKKKFRSEFIKVIGQTKNEYFI